MQISDKDKRNYFVIQSPFNTFASNQTVNLKTIV